MNNKTKVIVIVTLVSLALTPSPPTPQGEHLPGLTVGTSST